MDFIIELLKNNVYSNVILFLLIFIIVSYLIYIIKSAGRGFVEDDTLQVIYIISLIITITISGFYLNSNGLKKVYKDARSQLVTKIEGVHR